MGHSQSSLWDCFQVSKGLLLLVGRGNFGVTRFLLELSWPSSPQELGSQTAIRIYHNEAKLILEQRLEKTVHAMYLLFLRKWETTRLQLISSELPTLSTSYSVSTVSPTINILPHSGTFVTTGTLYRHIIITQSPCFTSGSLLVLYILWISL